MYPWGGMLSSLYASGRFLAIIKRGGWEAAAARLGVAVLLAGGLTVVTGGLAGATPALAGPAHAATPASPGGGHAGRIVWTQVLNDRFSSARLVSAPPAGSRLRAPAHPRPKAGRIRPGTPPDRSPV